LAQNFRYKGTSPTNHCLCRKTKRIFLSYAIKIWAEVSFVLSQFMHLTDGRTDSRRPQELVSTCRYALIKPQIMSYKTQYQLQSINVGAHSNNVSDDEPCTAADAPGIPALYTKATHEFQHGTHTTPQN